MTYFTRATLGTPEHHTRAITAAYREAGIKSPGHGIGARAALAAEPTAADTARAIVLADLDQADPTKWLAQSLAAITRAAAADTLKQAFTINATIVGRKHLPVFVAEAVTACQPSIAKAFAQLVQAAKQLPEGAEPLDLKAVVDRDATVPMKQAHAALHALGVFASLWSQGKPGDLHAAVRDLLPVVQIAAVPVDIVSNYTRETTNPSANRDTLRLFIKDTAVNGPDNALVRVARGEYGDIVTLDYATTRAEVNARFERAHQAIRRQVDTSIKANATIGISDRPGLLLIP